jgi:predicted nuclease of predicted toxin-antitoxin system
MRILCDESVPLAVERFLAATGHDVVAVRERLRGAADRVVLQHAIAEERLLITYDRDFGTLLFRDQLRPAPLVLYVRTATLPSNDGPRIVEAIRHVEPGYFYVVHGTELRKRAIDVGREGDLH